MAEASTRQFDSLAEVSTTTRTVRQKAVLWGTAQHPYCEITPLIRTSFDDQDAWVRVLSACEGEDFEVAVVDDPSFEGCTPSELARLAAGCFQIVFAVDGRTLSERDQPVLVVNTLVREDEGAGEGVDEDDAREAADRPGSYFRAVPSRLVDIWVNVVLLYNAWWSDYAGEAESSKDRLWLLGVGPRPTAEEFRSIVLA